MAIVRSVIASMDIVSLNDIICEYVNSPEHANLLNHHQNVQVGMQLESLLADISGSAVHLSKVLMNLVSNAAEAMPEGGVVRIKTENLYMDDPAVENGGKKPYTLETIGVALKEALVQSSG